LAAATTNYSATAGRVVAAALALLMYAQPVQAAPEYAGDYPGPNVNQPNVNTGSTFFSDAPMARTVAEGDVAPPPPQLIELQNQKTGAEVKAQEMGLQIRADALREAALSYGARGGLAMRTFEIQRRLAEQDASLGKTFAFKRLLIAAPSGLLIEPPIVSEAERAVIVGGGGQQAAVADKIYRINRVARIVTAARDWRLYLERNWGTVDPPPGLLLPKDRDEQKEWRVWVQEGWNAGVVQADDIFQADLDRMTNDFVGMVRYRELLAQNMISPPYASHEDRGVTGGGSEMRIGDRGVTITGQSELISKSKTWTPTTR
jgi:defect in organelle trafficking protein DotC